MSCQTDIFIFGAGVIGLAANTAMSGAARLSKFLEVSNYGRYS